MTIESNRKDKLAVRFYIETLAVNFQPSKRIFSTTMAKEHLEQQHSETIVKIGEMDSSIKSLEKAIASKQGPLATCQQRLQQRKQR